MGQLSYSKIVADKYKGYLARVGDITGIVAGYINNKAIIIAIPADTDVPFMYKLVKSGNKIVDDKFANNKHYKLMYALPRDIVGFDLPIIRIKTLEELARIPKILIKYSDNEVYCVLDTKSDSALTKSSLNKLGREIKVIEVKSDGIMVGLDGKHYFPWMYTKV